MYLFWIIVACSILSAIRMIIGPSVWDRLLAMNLLVAKTIMLIVVFASQSELSYLLDFAIIYAILGFIGAIFIALFLLERIKGGKE